MAVRNVVAHLGQQDMSQHNAERALDTMTLLCGQIDPDTAEELRELYNEMRSRAKDAQESEPIVIYRGAEQPESESARRASTDGLLHYVGTEYQRKDWHPP